MPKTRLGETGFFVQDWFIYDGIPKSKCHS